MSRKRLSLLAIVALAAAALIPTAAFGGGRSASSHTVGLKMSASIPGTLRSAAVTA